MWWSDFIEAHKNLALENWEKSGYVATTEWTDNVCWSTWTEGVEYVVLDAENIAFRLTGDWRDNGDWEVVHKEEFFSILEEDWNHWQESEEGDDSPFFAED